MDVPLADVTFAFSQLVSRSSGTAEGSSSGGHASCAALISAGGATPTPEPDVAGYGILAAFIICAYGTFLVTLGSYIFGYMDAELLRPVDLLVHKVPSHPGKRRGRKVIQKFILLISDQQIVTGIAMLISGYLALAKEGHHAISTYHFHLVIYLAWMASSVNLSALTALSGFLDHHKAVLVWRLIGMTILTVMLLVALMPTASNMWGLILLPPFKELQFGDDGKPITGWGLPASCFFFRNHDLGVNADAPLAMVLLLISFIWKVSHIFHAPRVFYTRYVRGPLEHVLEKTLHKQALTGRRTPSGETCLRYRLTMVVYVWIMAQNELLHSFAASLHLSWIGIVFGSVQIYLPRYQNDYLIGGENEWNFGQIVPLILVILPLGILLEHWKPGACISRSKKEKQRQWPSKGPAMHAHEVLEKGRPSQDSWDSSYTMQKTYMSDVFAAHQITRLAHRPTQPFECHLALFSSRLFKALIIMTQVGATLVLVAALTISGLAIGYVSTKGATFFVAFGGMVCVCITTMITALVAVPFSRLYK